MYNIKYDGTQPELEIAASFSRCSIKALPPVTFRNKYLLDGSMGTEMNDNQGTILQLKRYIQLLFFGLL